MSLSQRRRNVLSRLRNLFSPTPAPVSPQAARSVLDGLQSDFDRRVTAFANGLAENRLTVEAWQSLMEQSITRYHLSAALAANGNQPTPQVIALAQRNAEEQIGYLRKWTEDIRSNKFPMNATRLRNRALLYRGAGNRTLNQAIVAGQGINLPQTPGDGQTVCRHWCKCHLEIIDAGTLWFVYWRLGRGEHCPDCLRLAGQWNPLRIAKV